MATPAAARRIKSELLALIRSVPVGHVVTVDLLAGELNVLPGVIATLLSQMSEDERDAAPWYRVVAKGGAIGRGPHRDAHFAKLVREGVPVSPAGIVQDMGRVAVASVDAKAPALTRSTGPQLPLPAAPPGRSRGMKDRPS